MTPPRWSFRNVLDQFRPGHVVYLPGAVGELRRLREAMTARPEALDGVTLVSVLVPGMNAFDYAALHPGVRLRTFLLPPALRTSFERGRVELLPLAYSATAEHLAALAPDIALLRVGPPAQGRCSFGVCADFGPIVAASAGRRIGVVDTRLPLPTEAPDVALADVDAIVEIDEALAVAPPAAAGGELQAIARRVAGLIPDGAAVQTGIGGAPEALWKALQAHRGLRLRSGMVTDGFLRAFEAGAMAPDGHVAGIAYGGDELYERLHDSSLVAFTDVRGTHGAPALAGVEKLHAVNSALEVDLFGQINLEWRSGRQASGVGGAPDFVSAAQRSPGGRAIIALPSIVGRDRASRIVARLDAPTVSLPRSAADLVVTEHGVADLSGADLDGRARALVAIADPDHRESLAAAWAALRRTL